MQVCKSWRQRIYYYSSATVFQTLSRDLEDYMDEHDDAERLVGRLENTDDLHSLVGEAMVKFISLKPSFFRDAMISKKHFWGVPCC